MDGPNNGGGGGTQGGGPGGTHGKESITPITANMLAGGGLNACAVGAKAKIEINISNNRIFISCDDTRVVLVTLVTLRDSRQFCGLIQ